MAAPQVVPVPTRTGRWPWVDRLKVLTISVVVVVHTATAYVVQVDWYYEERTTSAVSEAAVSLPVFVAAISGLAPLFFVGGWLASVSLARRGTAGFVRSRLLRLGVPALVCAVVVDALADYLGSHAAGGRRSFLDYLIDPAGDHDVGPVWFVVALLALSLAYAGWRAVRPRPDPPVRGSLTVRALVVTAACITAADLLVWTRWSYFGESWWNLYWPHWPQAAGVFVLGVLAGERSWLERWPTAVARRCGELALLGSVLLMLLVAGVAVTTDDLTNLGKGWAAPVFAVLDGTVAVTLTVWVVGWMSRRWNGALRPVTALAARAAYATYLLHPLAVVAVTALARPLPWPPEVKLLVLAPVAVVAAYALGWAVTRLPGVNRVL